MIVRPRPKGWELLSIVQLSLVPRIAPQILGLSAFAAVIAWVDHQFPAAFRGYSVAPFTLLGIAISIFLGFRNNACYDRWWEARHQLGMLISEVRSLTRITLATRGGDRERRVRFVRGVIAWVYALMAHLRGETMPDQVLLYSAAAATAEVSPAVASVPDALLQALAGEVAGMLADREFGEQVYQRLDERMSNMATIQAACERIRTTPTPFAYTLLLHRTAYAFCFLLPFGLVGTFGYAAPIFSALVAYAFFGLDALGDEMQEPFGDWPNALPLNALARIMEISLLQALGEPELPPPLQPVDSILR